MLSMIHRFFIFAFVTVITMGVSACNMGHDDTILLQQGRRALAEGRLDQAVGLLERAAIANRKNVTRWRELADAYAKQGDAADLAKVQTILAELEH